MCASYPKFEGISGTSIKLPGFFIKTGTGNRIRKFRKSGFSKVVELVLGFLYVPITSKWVLGAKIRTGTYQRKIGGPILKRGISIGLLDLTYLSNININYSSCLLEWAISQKSKLDLVYKKLEKNICFFGSGKSQSLLSRRWGNFDFAALYTYLFL